MNYIFLVNPIAGKGRAKSLLPQIQATCEALGLSYQIKYTLSPGSATVIARNYTVQDQVCLVAVGGDGTAYECLNGLNPGVTMAIIPAGTGNDYYRMIGPQLDPEILLSSTLQGKLVQVDYGISNNCKFLNCTSFGIDAAVNKMVCVSLKKTIIPSSMAYGVSAVANILHPQSFQMTVKTPERTIEKKALLVAIMNGAYYGNGVCPTEKANLQDGLFHVCIIRHVPQIQLPFLLPKYMKGKAESIKEAEFLTASNLSITCDHPVCVQSDGELFEDATMDFHLEHQGLTLLVPQDSTLK